MHDTNWKELITGFLKIINEEINYLSIFGTPLRCNKMEKVKILHTPTNISPCTLKPNQN